MTERENLYNDLRLKMEEVGFKFVKDQKPVAQYKNEKELIFKHPDLRLKFEELNLDEIPTLYYIKPLSNGFEPEIGFVTGKTSQINKLNYFNKPNSKDIYRNLNAWVNKSGDLALDNLLLSIKYFINFQNFETEKELDKLISNINVNQIKKALVKIRIGQSDYRKKLIEYWKSCSVSGCENQEILIASHIKPYFLCNEIEVFDIYNGLLLAPNFDKLFDNFLITFDSNGNIIISSSLSKSDLLKLGITSNHSINPNLLSPNHIKYLKFHNSKFYKREKYYLATANLL